MILCDLFPHTRTGIAAYDVDSEAKGPLDIHACVPGPETGSPGADACVPCPEAEDTISLEESPEDTLSPEAEDAFRADSSGLDPD